MLGPPSEAVRPSPKDAATLNKLSKTQHSKETLDEVIVGFRRALEQNPRDASMLKEFKRLMEQNPRNASILDQFRRALESRKL